MHQRQHQQFLATPLKQDADNDSGTRSTALYQIMRRSSWSALSIWMMEELSLTLMTHRQAIVSKYIIISLLCSYWLSFSSLFSRQQSDGFNALSKLKTKHWSVPDPRCAADGRHLRKLTGMASWCCRAMLKRKQGAPHPVMLFNLLEPRATCLCPTRLHITPWMRTS